MKFIITQLKSKGKPTLIHHLVLEINLEQHFLRPRRSHDRIWRKLVLQQKYCSVLENILRLHITRLLNHMLQNHFARHRTQEINIRCRHQFCFRNFSRFLQKTKCQAEHYCYHTIARVTSVDHQCRHQSSFIGDHIGTTGLQLLSPTKLLIMRPIEDLILRVSKMPITMNQRKKDKIKLLRTMTLSEKLFYFP